MITIVGTGHVFNITESMKFIIEQIWPQAVLVELDKGRYDLYSGEPVPEGERSRYTEKDLPWIYRNAARYQARISKKNGVRTGNELITAVLAGRLVGAEVGFIDCDAIEATVRMWDEMPFGERFRYVLSTFRDRIGGRREAVRAAERITEDEDRVIAEMRRRYPVMTRNLIDRRNEYMYGRISGYIDRYDNVVIVVGDMHVTGLVSMLEGREVRVIRFGDIINKERFDRIRRELWAE